MVWVFGHIASQEPDRWLGSQEFVTGVEGVDERRVDRPKRDS